MTAPISEGYSSAGRTGSAGKRATSGVSGASGTTGASGASGTAGAAPSAGRTAAPSDSSPWGQWTPPAVLDEGSATIARPVLTRNRKGDSTVAWWKNDSDKYFSARRFVNGVWDTKTVSYGAQMMPNFDNVSKPGLALDGTGIAHLFFNAVVNMYTDNTLMAYGQTWDGQTRVNSGQIIGDQPYASSTLMAANEAGTAYAIWAGVKDLERWPMYVNTYSVGGWGTPTQIGYMSYWEAVYYSNFHSGGWVWVSLSNTHKELKLFIGQGADVWSPAPIQLPAASAIAIGNIGYAMDGTGQLGVALLLGDESVQQKGYWIRCAPRAETCDAPEQILDGPVRAIDVVMRDASPPTVLTLEPSDQAGSGHVVVRTRVDQNLWSDPQTISDDFLIGDTSQIKSSTNASGAMIAVWLQGTKLADGSAGKALAYNHVSKDESWWMPGIVTTYTGSTSITGVTLADDEHALLIWQNAATSDGSYHLKWSRN
jgi:hypothetical protein